MTRVTRVTRVTRETRRKTPKVHRKGRGKRSKGAGPPKVVNISFHVNLRLKNATGIFSGNDQSPEDFHAQALHHVQRYRQMNPRRIVEGGSADAPSLEDLLRFPAKNDAGLWRVRVKVSLWARLASH